MAAHHDHERWMLQESAQGGLYCAPCGQHIPFRTPEQVRRLETLRAHEEGLSEDIATYRAEGRDRSELIALRNEVRAEMRDIENNTAVQEGTPA
jgi:hypothetical protein